MNNQINNDNKNKDNMIDIIIWRFSIVFVWLFKYRFEKKLNDEIFDNLIIQERN